jgi:4-hydroxybenzoate polyprenyltransferase
MIRSWLHLCRISNLPTVWSNVLAGWLLAGGAWDSGLGWVMLCGSLMYCGGMVLNDVCDAAFDRQHQPHRPIAAGRVSWAGACLGALLMLAMGLGLGLSSGAQPPLLLGLAVAIVAYDLYHKPWAGSVLVMGLCRSLLMLVAASAAGPWQQLWPQAAALGCYVVGITLVARLEQPGQGSKLTWAHPAYLVLMAPAMLSLVHVAIHRQWLSAVICQTAFLTSTTLALGLMRRGGPSVGAAVGLLLAAMPVVDALALQPRHPWLALSLLPLPIALRLWQRWVAAT